MQRFLLLNQVLRTSIGAFNNYFCAYQYATLYYGLLIQFTGFDEELNILRPSKNIF